MDLSTLKLHFSKEIEVSNILDGINNPRKYDLVRDWCDRCYHEPKEYELKLEAVNVIMGENGVESLIEDGKAIASYVNNGDTYKPTVVYDHEEQEFLITSWGEFLEEWQAENLIEIDCEYVANMIHTISHLLTIDWDEWIENGETDDDPQIDIRLQVTEDNGYYVHYGLSDFDQDHHGAWGSSSVGKCVSMEKAMEIAKELIEEAAESADCSLAKTVRAYNDDN
jgi:hypothetical protein